MIKLALAVGTAFGLYASSSFAADCAVPSATASQAELLQTVICLTQNSIQKGDAVQLSFSAGQCLAAPSGVGGQQVQLSNPPGGYAFQNFTLLQGCGSAPKLTVTK
jgi:hypothetical protein